MTISRLLIWAASLATTLVLAGPAYAVAVADGGSPAPKFIAGDGAGDHVVVSDAGAASSPAPTRTDAPSDRTVAGGAALALTLVAAAGVAARRRQPSVRL